VNDATETRTEDFWTRLRRRKVVQWGLAYVAAAWGLLQGTGFLADAFHWPDAAKQIATLVLLIGLPIVLVLAWYHGDRGEQRASSSEIAMLVGLLLAGGGVLWWHQRAVEGPANAVNPPAVKPVVDSNPRPSIAVLPFENRSRLEDDVFFVDGIHDDILMQLTKVGALKVIARTSVEQFRGTKLTTKEIGEKLGVTKVLEGGVQRAGDRVRVTVQLIDTATDAHLWAENYDRELSAANIFAIQSEVAAAIAGALKATLTPGERARVDAIPTQDLEAWQAYQIGKQRMAKRTIAALIEAEKFFRKAISLDPQFALAYVGLADTLRLGAEYGGKPLEATIAEADRVISKALELDANLAEAWASKGGIAWSRGQDDQAEKLIRKAIDLNPNYATAHHWLSQLIESNGSLEEALVHSERAAELDPMSAITQVNVGGSLELAGRFDRAAARYGRAVDVDPTSPVAMASLALLNAYARNRFAEAVLLQNRAVALDSDSPRNAGELALLWLDIGDQTRAMGLIDPLLRRWPDDVNANSFSAAILGSVGDDANAATHASKALSAYPRSHPLVVAMLRNADLLKGDLQAARARYVAYPELLNNMNQQVDWGNLTSAIDVALVFQRIGDADRASALLDASELAIRSIPRLGFNGYGVSDVRIHALRGNKAKALAALREAERAGWRGPIWRYYRDFDPALASIRNELEFKAVFADIERDMARQRAELAARPKAAGRS
jgi:TolB-like protein/Flp pilus assembly protein TadD